MNRYIINASFDLLLVVASGGFWGMIGYGMGFRAAAREAFRMKALLKAWGERDADRT